MEYGGGDMNMRCGSRTRVYAMSIRVANTSMNHNKRVNTSRVHIRIGAGVGGMEERRRDMNMIHNKY